MDSNDYASERTGKATRTRRKKNQNKCKLTNYKNINKRKMYFLEKTDEAKVNEGWGKEKGTNEHE
jgi:hypothetical protein